MAWTYHDYEEQTTDATRLSRLRSHVTEVQQAIQVNLMAGGKSKDTRVVREYLEGVLRPRLHELERRANARQGRFQRWRPV